jgi:hypothetical protein
MSDKQLLTEDGTAVKSAESLYVCLPRDVAKFPPIAHRGDNNKALLQPFVFAILAAVIRGGWAVLEDQRHQSAMKAGSVAVNKDRQRDQKFKDECAEHRDSPEDTPAPKRRSILRLENPYKPRIRWGKRHVGRVGSAGYRQDKQQTRQQPPPAIVPLTLTRYRLARLAGLPRKGDYLRQLDAALDRLCDFVGYENQSPGSPPLVGWSPQGRKLELQVSGAWLQPRRYVRVPMPLPLRSATALALYLFLHVSQEGGEITFTTLCQRLGIPADYGDSRALKRALAIVNIHLGTFTEDEARALLAEGIDLPESYEIKKHDDGRLLTFKARQIHWPHDIDDGEYRNADADEYEDDEAGIEADSDEPEQEAPIARRPLMSIVGGDIEDDQTEAEAPIERRQLSPQGRARLEARLGLAFCEVAAAHGDHKARARLGINNEDDDEWNEWDGLPLDD